MKATPSQIEKFLVVLAESPHRISVLTHALDDARLYTAPDKKGWSVSDILAHLRSCADIWTHSIYAMLAEKEPVLPDINERKWAKVTRYAELPFADSFQCFISQRDNLLRVLRDLPLESWEKSTMIFGRKHTVFSQVRRMALHEIEHCDQIEGLLNQI